MNKLVQQLICTVAVVETLMSFNDKDFDGAPESMLFIPCQQFGMSLDDFRSMLFDMIKVEALEARGAHRFVAGPKAASLASGLNRILADLKTKMEKQYK